MISRATNKMKNNCFNLDNCYFIKTILLLIVAVYHSCLWMVDGWIPTIHVPSKSQVLLVFAGWLSSFHIYAFVLISGYVFCYKQQECGSYRDYKSFVINKVRRLILPALFVTIIWVAPIDGLAFNYSFLEIVDRFFLALNPSQLWFSWMLFWVFIICWPLSKLFNNSWGRVLVVFLFIVGSFGGHIIPNYFQLWTGCEFVLFFWIGWFIRSRITWIESNRKIVHFVLLIVADLALYCISSRLPSTNLIWRGASFGVNTLLHITGSVMAFMCLQFVASKVNWKNNTVIHAISSKTMTIYLLHQQFIYLTVILLVKYDINPYLQTLINFLVAVVCSWLIGLVLLRWKVTRILLGEKRSTKY